tara:strand:+ start:1155 stop:1328 length:174 start_codon:yes stop_codon:yes gene_type:complete
LLIIKKDLIIKMPVIENLDIMNILEINQIRQLLLPHPDLLALFEILMIIVNNRINEE